MCAPRFASGTDNNQQAVNHGGLDDDQIVLTGSGSGRAFPADTSLSREQGKRSAMGGPFRVMAAGCGGFDHHDGIAPTGCERPATVAGLRYSERGRTTWLGFACDQHAEHLIAPRALLPRDRDVLTRRQDRQRTELGGRRWAGEREGPLARGRDAVALLERARAWAAVHPYPGT